MSKFGSPPRFIEMVRQFHNGMQARVQYHRRFSEVTNGEKQGCVVTYIVRMMFSAMLMLFRTMILVFQSGTVMMAIYSTLEDCKPKLKVHTDVVAEPLRGSMQMIWIRMPAQRRKCKGPWIKSHNHVITMISQLAQTSKIREESVTFLGVLCLVFKIP